jgi:hypothetical protein
LAGLLKTFFAVHRPGQAEYAGEVTDTGAVMPAELFGGGFDEVLPLFGAGLAVGRWAVPADALRQVLTQYRQQVRRHCDVTDAGI